MPVIAPRQSRSSSNSGLTPLRIAGIVLVIVLACFFMGLFVWRRRKLKKREAESSRRARRLIKTAFARSRSAPPPPLPPYEPPREGHELQTNPTGGEAATSPTMPPPARLNTPPGYGAHVMDRPAGPISDSPPAYQEQDQRTWGRSGCPR